MVRLLLEKGADTNVKTSARIWQDRERPLPINYDPDYEPRKTPLDLAVKGGHPAVVDLLQVYREKDMRAISGGKGKSERGSCSQQ